jgi:hypothetical protein
MFFEALGATYRSPIDFELNFGKHLPALGRADGDADAQPH